MDYEEIKIKDLEEGQSFWRDVDRLGDPDLERTILNGRQKWTASTSMTKQDNPNSTVRIIKEQDKMDDLQARLELVYKYKKGHEDCISMFDKDIPAIKTKIADSEVTYSIGDRFTFGTAGSKRILAEAKGLVGLVSLSAGESQTDFIQVGDITKITLEEFRVICTGRDYVRYWDNRKQCRC